MRYTIREYDSKDLDAIVELSLLAWDPIFNSFQQIFGQEIYSILYPDWRQSQKEGVESVCGDHEKYAVIVAEYETIVIGFLAYELKEDDQTGEVILLAVHPEYQNNGIGTELNKNALKRFETAGMKMAVVETGGDPTHAPARRSYEKAGYTALPIVRYFKDI
jgi:ribosomal protein S18 acetylase RimI-like enzyme